MKNVIYSLLLSLCSTLLLANEKPISPNLKFGKPTLEELNMTTYAPDSSAAAVVLYKKTDVSYRIIANDFQIIYVHKVKIKVLKSEGTNYANVAVSYYESKNNATSKESITQLDANAYNLENGKIVRTKMKKDLVFKERLNNSHMQLKFSIPQVKVGTVIEYEYQLQSDFYYSINNWKAQEEIPTLYTEYDITVPEYFKFNVETRGSERLIIKETPKTVNYHIMGQLLQAPSRNLNFKGEQLPAIKGDKYVWCPDDYCMQVNFELKGLDFPGAIYKSFTQTWENIDDLLLDDKEFGGRFKMNNPLKAEMAGLELDKMENNHEKISALFTLLKSKVRWNNRYALYGNSSRQTLKEGTGDNADINFIFMSMLRDAGIQAYPVVMSRRNKGIIPYTHPSIQKLNTFVVGILETDSTLVYLDGSVENGYINILPTPLLVNRARMIIPNNKGMWVDLSALNRNQLTSMVKATITPEGIVTGSRETNYTGQYAAHFRSKYYAAKDSTDFINQLNSRENMQTNAYGIDGLRHFSPQLKETLDFKKQATINGDFIYIKPLVFLHTSEPPFKQEERNLPVEFNHPEQISLNINLTIPEGYVVDEKPTPAIIRTNDQKLSCRYTITQQSNQIIIRYIFRLDKTLFLKEEYEELKKFWEFLVEKNNEMMVLKKI